MKAYDELIDIRLPKTFSHINIYTFGDKHIGSAQANIQLLKKQINDVKADELGVLIICGDMLDFGLKNSKTNIYESVLTPFQQKELLYELLEPVAEKIIAIIPGNHEDRGFQRNWINPMYDVACSLKLKTVIVKI